MIATEAGASKLVSRDVAGELRKCVMHRDAFHWLRDKRANEVGAVAAQRLGLSISRCMETVNAYLMSTAHHNGAIRSANGRTRTVAWAWPAEVLRKLSKRGFCAQLQLLTCKEGVRAAGVYATASVLLCVQLRIPSFYRGQKIDGALWPEDPHVII